MKIVKLLTACSLLGLMGLTACGKPDTVQESELQPSEPREAERERILSQLADAGSQSEEQPICRNLRQGDPWYPQWTYCCDNDTRTQSYWTSAEGSGSGMFNGSCYSFGLR
jgi:hypothetical protein